MFPLSGKVEVLDIEKKKYTLRLTIRTTFLSVKLWRKKKKFLLVVLPYLKMWNL